MESLSCFRRLGVKIPTSSDLEILVGPGHADFLTRLDFSVSYASEHGHPLIIIEPGIENQGFEGTVGVARG